MGWAGEPARADSSPAPANHSESESLKLADAELTRLPRDTHAEQHVLSLLMDTFADRVAEHQAADYSEGRAHCFELLKPEYFTRPTHSRLFVVLKGLLAAGKPRDIADIHKELERTAKRGDKRIDPTELVELAALFPPPVLGKAYAERVRSAALRRRLIQVAGEIGKMAYDDALSGDESWARAVKLLGPTKPDDDGDNGVGQWIRGKSLWR